MMTPEDRERLRANAQAAMDRVDAMNGEGGSPEYSSDERPFPDEILELLDELDRLAGEQDALAGDNIALRDALARAAILAETRINLALEILDGRFRPTDRIGDLHGAMIGVLRGDL